MKNTLVLCGGGPDAVVAAAKLRQEGDRVTLLFFNYGQKAWNQELSFSLKSAADQGLPLRELRVNVFDQIKSGILSSSDEAGQHLHGMVSHVPARNLILLSIAAGYAQTHGYNRLAIGNIKNGFAWDNHPLFVLHFNELLKVALGPVLGPQVEIDIVAPVNHLEKHEVIQLGLELGVDFAQTWSCYKNGRTHCGLCASCVGRRAAFIKIGKIDPMSYACP